MTMVRIDPLRGADADVVARLQDDLWRATYSGLLPSRVLDGRDDADNVARWRERAVAHEEAGCSAEGARTLVAHDEDGVAIGWASTGPPRDDNPPTDTELWSLYLASRHHGSGVAEQLMEAVLPSRHPRLGADEVRMVRLRPAG
ncbi:GNAT family N-acetyltransferase [Janibacter cremeus]|nr:GNAT family N-acetyltransferase [Janibacter cremeus]